MKQTNKITIIKIGIVIIRILGGVIKLIKEMKRTTRKKKSKPKGKKEYNFCLLNFIWS